MTYEEAVDNIACALDGGCHQVCNVKYRGYCNDSEIVESVKLLRELVEKTDKYKWHDLRKNPDDLPAANTDWIICVKEKNENYIYATTGKVIIGNNLYDAQDVDITVLKRGIGKMYGDVFCYANKVILWRNEEVKA